MEAARTVFKNAVLAESVTVAEAQAANFASRTALLIKTKLGAEAVFEIGILAVLKSCGPVGYYFKNSVMTVSWHWLML